MKITGVIAIVLGIFFTLLPLVSTGWVPYNSWFIGVILLVGGFFLYRGLFRKSARKSTP
jgi:uncharacterized membrane protein HdeD (DUF308 family)